MLLCASEHKYLFGSPLSILWDLNPEVELLDLCLTMFRNWPTQVCFLKLLGWFWCAARVMRADCVRPAEEARWWTGKDRARSQAHQGSSLQGVSVCADSPPGSFITFPISEVRINCVRVQNPLLASHWLLEGFSEMISPCHPQFIMWKPVSCLLASLFLACWETTVVVCRQNLWSVLK